MTFSEAAAEETEADWRGGVNRHCRDGDTETLSVNSSFKEVWLRVRAEK